MNEIVNQLAQSLFKKNSLQECSRWELEILADHYPYFGIAQFLVTGKLKSENAEDYDRQLQKTSLYFTNPLWLDYVISDKSFDGQVDQSAPENKALEALQISDTLATEESAAPELKQMDGLEIGEQGIPTDRRLENTDINKDREILSSASLPEPVEEKNTGSNISPAEEADNTEFVETSEDRAELPPLRFTSLTNIPSTGPLTFEPYHTIDYFASQGIKVATADKPKDRFEQQLKSFTQWLKTIKQVPVTEIVKESGVDAEANVIALANHSIEDREILTEAMADVWIKQGEREKAMDVYHKLSLQNPAKSAYFASLIEQLKQP